MGEAVDLAAKTPFDLQGVASGARQLLAYGFEAENVTDTLRRLGDVAAGLGLPLQRLTYLYGTTRVQGRLFTRDMLQFTNSGIPLLDELAKMYGKTTAEINNMVSAGKIGFADVEKVIRRMTDEGGQFANLMEKQSKTITGQISNIKDAIDTMFNEIGKKNEGFINTALKGVSVLVENYEKVGQVLGDIIVMYGSYKAALMTVSAAHAVATATAKGYTLAELAQYRALLLAEKAQKLLNKTMLSNPYVLAATAIAGLVRWSLRYNKSITDGTKATSELEKEVRKLNAADDEKAKKAAEGIAAMKNEKTAQEDRIKAMEELIKLYPELLEKYKEQKADLIDIRQLEQDIADAQLRRQMDHDVTLLNDYESSLKALNEQLEQAKADMNDSSTADAAIQSMSALESEILKTEQKIDTLRNKLYGDTYSTLFNGPQKPLFTNPESEKKTMVSDIVNEIKDAEKQLDSLRVKAKSGLTEKEQQDMKDIEDRIAKAKAEYKSFTGKEYGKTGSSNTASDKSDVDERQMRLKVEEARIKAMQDGLEKRLREAKLEEEESIAEIDDEQRELEERLGTPALSEDMIKQFEDRRKAIHEAADNRIKELENEREEYIAGLYEKTGDVFLSEEQRKINAIKKTYDAQRKQLTKDLAAGNIGENDYDSLLKLTDAAEKKEIDDYWLNTFAANTDLLNKEKELWAKRIAEAPDNYREVAKKAAENAISDLAAQIENADIDKMFEHLSTLTFTEIDNELEKLRTSAIDLNSEDYNQLLQRLKELRKQLANQNPFTAVGEAWRALSKDMSWDNFEDALTATSGLAQNFRSISDAMRDIAKITGNEALAQAADIADDVIGNLQAAEEGAEAWGGWWGAIIGGLTDLIPKIVKWSSGDVKFTKALVDMQKEVDNLSDEYDNLREAEDKAFGKNKLAYIDQENANLAEQNRLIREQISIEQEKKNSDQDAIDQWNKQLEENQKLYAENKAAALDAVLGSDMQAAISGFQSSLTGAWAKGKEGAAGAKEFVNEQMRQMVNDSIKAFVQAKNSIENIRRAMSEAMLDEIVTDEEVARVEQMATELADEVERKYGWAAKLFQGDTPREAATKNSLGASQDSVDESNGRLTALQGIAYDIRDGQRMQTDVLSDLRAESASILDEVMGIHNDTAEMRVTMGDVRAMVKEIRSNVGTMTDRGVKML